MKKILLAFATLTLIILPLTTLKAQSTQDPVIMEVGGQSIRQSEFMHEFNTNVVPQLNKRPNITYAEKRAALDEYVELYALFRAKLLDAHEQGFDTAAALTKELSRYRKELAAPYLIDSTVLHNLLNEAYERNHYSLHAAHILVQVAQDASPEDTLKAYNNAMGLYKRIVNDGEDFFAVSADYVKKHNVNAKVRENEGDLGYFSVFDMVYPFENAAYALKVGEVSKPVRTRYGYHIIKLLDRLEGIYGKVSVAHIWLHSTDSASRRDEINMMHLQLMGGTPFEQVAIKSDDRSTAKSGGLMANVSLSQLPPEYIQKMVDMKVGEISKPFFTQYGWHILKLVRLDTLPPLENLEGFYKQRMTRDQRGEESRKSFAASSRRRYGIVDCTVTPVPKAKGHKAKGPVKMMASLDELMTKIPDSVRRGRWQYNEADFTDTTTLIITPNHRYTSRDVASYIAANQKVGTMQNLTEHITTCYNEFLDSITIDYADSQLEKEYPEFAQVVNEYRRGLMIFNYNDAMIWHKALNDSVGFTQFYARESVTKRLNNPDDSIYFFHIRARITVIDVTDANALAADKAQAIIAKAQKKNLGSTEMKQLLLKKINRKKYPDDNIIKVDVEQVEQTRQNILRDDQWERGVYLQDKGNSYRLVVVEEVLPRSLKGLMDARGYYLNTWQNEVERQLNDSLRQKYNVKIHRDVVHSIAF